jgi:thioredoxin reductase
VLAGDKVFLDVGTHAAIPNVPGLEAAKPLTHVEALELDYLPQHLIVIGGGYSGLELAQAYRHFGSDVTIIESGPQLMGREDIDVSREMWRILSDEGMRVLLEAQLLEVRGRSGDKVTIVVRTPSGEQNIDEFNAGILKSDSAGVRNAPPGCHCQSLTSDGEVSKERSAFAPSCSGDISAISPATRLTSASHHLSLFVSTAVIASPMLRHASSNRPSSA